MVASAMGKFTSKNEYARVHFRHYREHFRAFVDQALPKLAALVAEIKIEDYYAGDFIEQADRAEKSGGGVACFAPTYKGGYERIYKLVNENVDWPAPKYGIWNPDSLPGFIASLEAAAYSVLRDLGSVARRSHADNRMARREQARLHLFEQPGRIVPAPAAERSAVQIHGGRSRRDYGREQGDGCDVDSKRMTYLKNVYLAKGIDHTTGQFNCLVLIDGALAGGFIFAQTRFGDKTRELYMLSDFSVSRERRISKLIPMIASVPRGDRADQPPAADQGRIHHDHGVHDQAGFHEVPRDF